MRHRPIMQSLSVFAVVVAAAIIAAVEPRTLQAATSAAAAPPLARRSIAIGRAFDTPTSGVLNPSPKVEPPRILTKADWGGAPSSGTMRRHFPTRMTFHHEGGKRAAPDDVTSRGLQGLQKYGWNQKGWPDLPYHFLIDVKGAVYAGRDPMAVGDTNTKYDPTGHLLVTAVGNFDQQTPTEKQLDSIADLMAWACDRYNIDPATLAAHRDYADTACPGRYLYPYVVSGYLEGQVRERIAKAYSPAAAGNKAGTSPTMPAIAAPGPPQRP